MKHYEILMSEVDKFLESFKRGDFSDMKLYSKMKTYRSLHRKGKLGRKSYEEVLKYLGWQPMDIWKKE